MEARNNTYTFFSFFFVPFYIHTVYPYCWRKTIKKPETIFGSIALRVVSNKNWGEIDGERNY